tara:strand:- start:156 stop:1751 length:1596 start_codon:yes stop_codon:yes gene_type:complete
MKLQINLINNKNWHEMIISKSGSSSLSSDQRSKLIRKIANYDILLAAKCKTICHKKEIEDVNYISSLAQKVSNESLKPINASNGLLALAEIGEFEIITTMFNTQKPEKDILNKYIENADESHIVSLFEILYRQYKSLFVYVVRLSGSKDVNFSIESVKVIKKIAKSFLKKKEYVVLINIIGSLKLQIQLPNMDEIIDIAFKNHLISEAILIVELNNYQNRFDFYKYFNQVSEIPHSGAVVVMMRYARNNNYKLSLEQILSLSQNHNLKIKQRSISLLNKNYKNSLEINIKKIIEMNLTIDTVSSTQFAIDLMVEYHLEEQFNYISILDNLLESKRPGKLILASTIAINNNLLDYKMRDSIIQRLINTNDVPAIRFAIKIIKKTRKNYRTKLLKLAIELKKADPKYYRLAKEIVFTHVTPINDIKNIDIGMKFYAFVDSYFNGKIEPGFNLQFNKHQKTLFWPKRKLKLKVKSIVLICIDNVYEDKISFEVIDKNVEKNIISKNKYHKEYMKHESNSIKVTEFGEKLLLAIK